MRVERPPTPEARPELLVRNGPVWWTYKDGRGSVTNAGADNFNTGGDEVVVHLYPSVAMSQFRWTPTGDDHVASRHCLVVRAERRGATRDKSRMWAMQPSFNMIWGGNQFDVSVDAERGVLLRVAKLVDGKPAELREFVDIHFDEHFEDGLFRFASPDGSPIQDGSAVLRRRRPRS